MEKKENVCRVSACLFIRKHIDIAHAHCIQEKLTQFYCDISLIQDFQNHGFTSLYMLKQCCFIFHLT